MPACFLLRARFDAAEAKRLHDKLRRASLGNDPGASEEAFEEDLADLLRERRRRAALGADRG